METIVVQVNAPEKARALLNFLREMDFVTSAETLPDVRTRARQLLDDINAEAAQTDLTTMTLADIDEEIRQYRRGK